ncbi:peptide MFS transporter [Endozoicomonas numazuensis]|uniref:DeoR faimly transcriptional regulator n=1 Tax=Endozoicomonas numazuensis TaxID=1137799 RepID=A0A081NMH0_9GAMM|nr:MFS transporter [Endozoicomonas numazuensis]KEQ19643.1 DeoR faimly transcriptional regulator [Endozoicomonas numazuensis]
MWNKLNKSMMFCQMMFGLSFYGVMVILTRFFLEELSYSEADTMMVVGAFSSIGPLFAIAGGIICDKFLGSKRALTVAYICFAAGYVLLVLGSSSLNVPLSLLGIALASYARGLMSPSYPSLYKRTFKSQEDFENCYPINYSVNNVGALLGQYLYPIFVLTVGFAGGFTLSAVMAALAVGALVIFHKPLVSVGEDIDREPVSAKNMGIFLVLSAAMLGMVFFMFSDMDTGQYIVYAIGGAALLYYVSLIFKTGRADGMRMVAILVMTAVLTTAFFVYYGQMMTSMNIVAINTLKGDLLGFIPLAPEAAMALNPLWCIVMGPVITLLFANLEKRGIQFTTATKISFAFVMTAVAFGILTHAVRSVGPDVSISPNVFLVIHGFQAFAEVIVGSLVVAFIISVTPKEIEGFSVSLYSVAIALSGIVGAVISGSIAMDKGQEITQSFVQNVYGNYFMMLTVAAVIMVAVALAASLLIKKMINQADEWDKTEALSPATV